MDPPRKGSDEKFLSSVLSRKPNQIIYISCDPETLARDILYLKDKYQVTFVQPVDMFPFTSQCETLQNMQDFFIKTNVLYKTDMWVSINPEGDKKMKEFLNSIGLGKYY